MLFSKLLLAAALLGTTAVMGVPMGKSSPGQMSAPVTMLSSYALRGDW